MWKKFLSRKFWVALLDLAVIVFALPDPLHKAIAAGLGAVYIAAEGIIDAIRVAKGDDS